MKCKSAEKLLPEYIEGALPPAKTRHLEAHLQHCLHCRKALSAFEATLRLSSHIPTEYPSPELWQAFWPSLRLKLTQQQRKRNSVLSLIYLLFQRWQVVGAALALVLLTSWGLTMGGWFKRQPVTSVETLDALISNSLAVDISVVGLKEELRQEIGNVDAVLVWSDQELFSDDGTLLNLTGPKQTMGKLFEGISAEITDEVEEYEQMTEYVQPLDGLWVFTSEE